MMTISGETMYSLLRYAHKNSLFDNEKKAKEVRKAFLHMRSTGKCGSDYETNIMYIGMNNED